MTSIVKAIRKEATNKGFQILQNDELEIYNKLDQLFLKSPNPDQELAFEQQLFTRGTNNPDRVGLHTSAVIGNDNHYCPREQVLSLIYKPRNMDKNLGLPLLRIFEEGNSVHKKWQRLFLRGNMCTYKELDKTQYNKKYRLAFSPDAIITIDNNQYIVEIKSMRSEAYRKAVRHSSGEIQCRMYMFLSGVDHGIILMENKNDQQFKINVISHDKEEISKYVDRLDAIKSYYESREMPPRLPQCKTKLSKRCQDCPFLYPCWGTKQERKELQIVRKR